MLEPVFPEKELGKTHWAKEAIDNEMENKEVNNAFILVGLKFYNRLNILKLKPILLLVLPLILSVGMCWAIYV